MKSNQAMGEKPQRHEDIVRKLFLGGISPNSTEDSLRSFYRQFGEILDLNIIRDSTTGRSRGFGFVTFGEASCVDRAQAARPHVVDGKAIDSKRVLPPAEGNKNVGNNSGRKIFVGGLKEAHDEVTLTEYFQKFGNILSIKILVDKNTGRRRGFGYIEFEDYDSADKAALIHNHTIKFLPVDVKKSTYKPETNKKFENDQNGNGQQNDAPAPPPPPQYPTGPYPPPYGYPPAPGYNGWGPPPPAPYPPQQQPPQWNGWGYNAPPANQMPNNNNYQQTYNGGPEKAGKLQGYRNKPYRV